MSLSAAQQIIRSEVARRLPDVKCEPEYRFDPERKWRFDLCWPSAMTAVEINGSIFTRGRHTRGKGFLADREKINRAQRLGFAVLEYATHEVDLEFGRVLDEIVELIQARMKP